MGPKPTKPQTNQLTLNNVRVSHITLLSRGPHRWSREELTLEDTVTLNVLEPEPAGVACSRSPLRMTAKNPVKTGETPDPKDRIGFTLVIHKGYSYNLQPKIPLTDKVRPVAPTWRAAHICHRSCRTLALHRVWMSLDGFGWPLEPWTVQMVPEPLVAWRDCLTFSEQIPELSLAAVSL